jgi:hypothetical protein
MPLGTLTRTVSLSVPPRSRASRLPPGLCVVALPARDPGCDANWSGQCWRIGRVYNGPREYTTRAVMRAIEKRTALTETVAHWSSRVALLREISKAEVLLAFALYVAGACVFFRQQIFSGFDLYFGDRGDSRMILFVHEHVYRALLGSPFLSPPEFYNLKNTLGGSDAFLLNQVVYAPLRLLGADPYWTAPSLSRKPWMSVSRIYFGPDCPLAWPAALVGHRSNRITPIVSLCLLASFAFSLRRSLWIGSCAELRRRVVLAASLAGILLILFTVRVGDFSLYLVLHALVPGARAIRLADRVLFVVNLFGAVAIDVTLAHQSCRSLIPHPSQPGLAPDHAGIVAGAPCVRAGKCWHHRMGFSYRRSGTLFGCPTGAAEMSCILPGAAAGAYRVPEPNRRYDGGAPGSPADAQRHDGHQPAKPSARSAAGPRLPPACARLAKRGGCGKARLCPTLKGNRQ